MAPSERRTYDDYAALPSDGRRYEVLQAELSVLAPAPTVTHQRLVVRLLKALAARPSAGGEVPIAPYDVVLADASVVQPDLLFVRGQRVGTIGEACIHGAPDLPIEVASPSEPCRASDP